MARVRGYRRKNNYKGFFIAVFVVAIASLLYFASQSDIFEKDSPKIVIDKDVKFWNPNNPIPIVFQDSSAIKSYSIVAVSGNGEKLIDIQEVVLDKPKEVKITLPTPQRQLNDDESIVYEISVTDWSSSNFFSGNTTTRRIELKIDTLPPKIEVLSSSYAINYGGSALIVFKAQEKNLKKLVFSNGFDEFLPFGYIAKDYYAILVAWPVKNNAFSPTIIATDLAGNQTQYRVGIVKRFKAYKDSSLKIQDKYFEKIDAMLWENAPQEKFETQASKFKYLNENIRKKDEQTIFSAANSFSPHMILRPIIFDRFYPLRGGMVVGHFADSRHYYYKDQNISNAYHMGLDLASVKNAPIIASNSGKVVLEKKLGIYGNTIIVYHDLGMASLYSHISEFRAKLGERVQEGAILANTGSTGWAFGDHLHFSILIQGHFVSLAEWMDAKWIQSNITSVFQKAEKIIKREKR